MHLTLQPVPPYELLLFPVEASGLSRLRKSYKLELRYRGS